MECLRNVICLLLSLRSNLLHGSGRFWYAKCVVIKKRPAVNRLLQSYLFNHPLQNLSNLQPLASVAGAHRRIFYYLPILPVGNKPTSLQLLFDS